ncbi:MAG TPA: slipin family protein [Flavobacteriales bacterium]|nr:slipin family protein [Flavobacteriales bacterium]
MMTQRIQEGKVALVFRNGNYQRVLKPGRHFIGLFDEVKVYDTALPFNAPIALELLLRDTELAALLTIVEVGDNQLVLKYRNGNFQEVLKPGRYAFFKGLIELKFITMNLSEIEINKEIDRDLLMKAALLPYIRVYSVEPHEQGILMVDGDAKAVLQPGVYFYAKNSTVIHVLKADLRLQQLEVNGQDILTKDKAALRINFNTQYRVTDIRKALLETKDFEKQLYVTVQLALREFIGTKTLDEILGNKEEVTAYVDATVKEKAEAIGVAIKYNGIKDIILPGDMKEIMNQVLIAQKKAEANTIMRREETASTRSLLNTAKLMEENAMLFKLKEMEYVEKIAEKVNTLSISGNAKVLDQLKEIFSPGKGPLNER